jgi:hypothetical protein
VQASDLLVEVALLLEVACCLGSRPVRLDGRVLVAGHLMEVAADGVETPVGVDPGIGSE